MRKTQKQEVAAAAEESAIVAELRRAPANLAQLVIRMVPGEVGRVRAATERRIAAALQRLRRAGRARVERGIGWVALAHGTCPMCAGKGYVVAEGNR